MNKAILAVELGLAGSLAVGCTGNVVEHDASSQNVQNRDIANTFHVGDTQWLTSIRDMTDFTPGGANVYDQAPGSKCIVQFGQLLVEKSPHVFTYRDSVKSYNGTTCLDKTRLDITVGQAKKQESDYQTALKRRALITSFVVKAFADDHQDSNKRPATFNWVTVVNPKPVHNGNGTFEFGDTCSTVPQDGGKIGTLAVLPDGQRLEEYTTNKETFGAPCAPGTLFLTKGPVQASPGEQS
jgi:hypothetical protein